MNTEYNKKYLQGAWILGIAFLSLLTILHLIKPELDPTWHLISEYEIGKYGWLMRLAFFCWGGGFILLTISLWSLLDSLSGKIGKWWLLIISFALFGAGIFATQPITDIIRGTIDRLHAVCGAIMIFTFPIASTIIAKSLSKHLSIRSAKYTLIAVTFLVWFGLIAFFSSMIIYGQQIKLRAYSDSILIGVPNRFMVLTYTIWLITIARLLNTHKQNI